VVKATWTYEVPPAGSDAVGLEDYAVETVGGAFLGKVKTVLRHDGRTYVLVESGPPLARRRHAVPTPAVAEIDHAALAIRLAGPPADLPATLELDPAQAAECETAEAVRVTQLPEHLTPMSSPDARGPVDRPSYSLALALGLVGVFAALALVLFATTTAFTWQFALFAVPAVLLALAALFAYRAFSRQSQPL
jgi:hypothetical protein